MTQKRCSNFEKKVSNNWNNLKKNYQLFRITDDRNIIVTLSGYDEIHYQLNFRRVHVDQILQDWKEIRLVPDILRSIAISLAK